MESMYPGECRVLVVHHYYQTIIININAKKLRDGDSSLQNEDDDEEGNNDDNNKDRESMWLLTRAFMRRLRKQKVRAEASIEDLCRALVATNHIWNQGGMEELEDEAAIFGFTTLRAILEKKRTSDGHDLTASELSDMIKVPRTKGVPQVLTELLSKSPVGTKLDPLVLAIGGDQTQHLLYRLSHGQLLPAYAQDRNSIFVVLIGTNNLGSGELPGPISQGVLAVAEYVLANTKGYLLLLKVLPRGDGGLRLPPLCPPRCSPSDGKPFTSFIPAVEKVNAAIADGLGSLGERHGPNRIGLIDCGSVFLADGDEATEVDSSLMPDLLHPNGAGHRLLGDCILKGLPLEKGRTMISLDYVC
jgi:lysophospholipase L1-like esterase